MSPSTTGIVPGFLSTPSGWRATVDLIWLRTGVGISIHALRVEGDISDYGIILYKEVFLSTPSGWRATRAHYIINRQQKISIHALRVEGDSKNGQSFCLFLRKREKNLPL